MTSREWSSESSTSTSPTSPARWSRSEAPSWRCSARRSRCATGPGSPRWSSSSTGSAGRCAAPTTSSYPSRPAARCSSRPRSAAAARCGSSAPPAARAAACRSTPMNGCWLSSALDSRRPRGGRDSASASPWSTLSPTSADGRVVAPATRGQRKNLHDLRRTAVVHNLHVIARQPQKQAA